MAIRSTPQESRGADEAQSRTFLTAQWRFLLMLNYAVDPDLLRPHVPAGVELDAWEDVTYASIVGFRFLNTRVLGVPMPCHVNFEELNLRFYVRRKVPEGWRRGVVFIKELVPRRLIAQIARACYNEPYERRPMRHLIETEDGRLRAGSRIQYSWLDRGEWNFVQARVHGSPALPAAGSVEEFITEHYWGYTAQRDGGCKEYQVHHVPWMVWQTQEAQLSPAAELLYRPKFAEALKHRPRSAFVADGSAVSVSVGRRITSPTAG